MTYPRDLVGYGPTPPDPRWPGGARLALQIVMNYDDVWICRRIDLARHWIAHHPHRP
jgi:hypothetical protein